MAMTLEGQIVRISDIVAYVNHDLDDAIRGKVVQQGEVPAAILAVLGATHSDRVARMVNDLVAASRDGDEAAFVLDQWVRFGHARHPHFLKPAAIADAITTVVSAPRGVHLNLIEVSPEAPLEDR